MTEKDNGSNSSVRQEKRSKFDQNEKPRSGSRRLLVLGAVGVLAIVVLYIAWSRQSENVNAAYTAADGGVRQDVRIPVSELSDGKARFYTYELAGGKQVKFFAVKSSDGVLRAAFDACDVCFEARLGYTQQEDGMLCNQCGRTFPLVKINTVSGDCNPAPLTRTVQGDQLVIKASDLEKGARYF